MARFGNFASNVVYINDKFSCNGSVFCFKLKKEYKKLINLKYVFELLKKNYKKIKKLNVDTNNKSITKAKIGEIEFEIPIN